MNTEPPLKSSPARLLRDCQLLRVSAAFFLAVCATAALLVLAVLALPGSARAADPIEVIGIDERTVKMPLGAECVILDLDWHSDEAR